MRCSRDQENWCLPWHQSRQFSRHEDEEHGLWFGRAVGRTGEQLEQTKLKTSNAECSVLIKDVETVRERAANNTGQGDICNVNVNRSLGGTMHAHELDTLRPVLNQLLAESFTGNNDGLQGWVVLERNDSKDIGSTVNNVDAEVLDGSSYVTEHEFLSSSDKSSTAGQGTEDDDDEGIESVGKRGENAGTMVVSIWLRILYQVRDRTFSETVDYAHAETTGSECA